MPVVQTPIPGDQLANMNEQMRAVAGALPAAPVIPPEMLQQAGAVTPEQELARLTSIMNAPFQSEMPVVSMARANLKCLLSQWLGADSRQLAPWPGPTSMARLLMRVV